MPCFYWSLSSKWHECSWTLCTVRSKRANKKYNKESNGFPNLGKAGKGRGACNAFNFFSFFFSAQRFLKIRESSLKAFYYPIATVNVGRIIFLGKNDLGKIFISLNSLETSVSEKKTGNAVTGFTRELKMETFSGGRRLDRQSKPETEAAVGSRQNSNIKWTQKDVALEDYRRGKYGFT